MEGRNPVLTICRLRAVLPLLAAMLLATATNAQTYSVLHTYSINSGAYSGILPAGLMSQGRDGNLYSTIANNGTQSVGTNFKITTSGTLTTLYNFCSQTSCSDGKYPFGGLTLGSDGNLYGTTNSGGTSGLGTAFKMTPAGQLTTLWTFSGTGTDEAAPWNPLFQAQDGNLWGVDPGVYNGNYGIAYKISPTGTFTPFPFNFTDGANPNLPTQGTDGNFYGTARLGGSKNLGVVYKMTPAGVITVLHNFVGYPTDGNLPVGVLVQGSDGNFYGTTYSGGANNIGSIFKISPTGVFTLLYSFRGIGSADGALPYTGLTLGTDGNLYGSTANGGKANAGVLFEVTPAGVVTILYSFCSVTGCTDGFYPETPLVLHTNGTFYGNSTGNSLGGSVLYSLNTGLKPFAKLVNWSGKVGKSIEMLGQGFTGTTSVSFNGTSATFTVVSDTYLTAVVPSGATTGFITVTTPSRALKSDRKFLVTPSLLSFSPSSGQVGTPVTITGMSFTGATRVAFGAVKATTFSVDSDTQITATVPTGAVTGKIQVTTPGGIATSSTSFTVLP